MKKLQGTKTEQNLINAFAGESQARNRYTIFAKIAKKEGYEQISEIFLDTAENEREHAKLFYKYIGNTEGHVDSTYPFELGTTEENLASGVKGETDEWETVYRQGEDDAREEGFDEIAQTFKLIRTVEEHHAKRYAELLKNIKEDSVFKKENEQTWVCRKCGYHTVSKSAPEKCPLCEHPKAYFEIDCEKF
ncbi:rubrerythrin family protein [Spirochaetes bacterium]|uniref:Rubrerythrin family protein n=1 Tax=Candidatus Scatousia excrementipullorum TaxID=2840936 RepID=A0A9D9DLN2_9BACT|nr:rubrerythrin family protein [Candidatus Scatousia excrementipullorum]